MAENRLKQIHQFGQSVWLDNIRKGLIASGELKRMVEEDGLRGVTSNPSIFEKAIAGSEDYAQALSGLFRKEASLTGVYESVVFDDIRAAAAVLRPVYDSSGGSDGFVSLEVPANLAYDTEKTISEARRLHNTLNLPNLMVKIPATKQGVPAIRQMIAEGRNINVTLIFSRQRYAEVMEAYLSGLEERASRGEPLNQINSVASFFVSRIDTAADKAIEERLAATEDNTAKQRLQALLGKVAIANAKLAYQDFKAPFESERFARLKAKGAKVQRPLWASTSTKNPQYRDVMYVEALIGPDTVDTMPPATMAAFRDHGSPADSLSQGVEEAKQVLQQLKDAGIDLDAITDELEREGVKQFAEAMDKLTHVLAVKREEVLGDLLDKQTASLPGLQEKVDARLAAMQEQQFGRRYWEKDPSLWHADEHHAAVIKNRLGWLEVPDFVLEQWEEIRAFVDEVRRDGFTHAVVLGMGGSSLCPEALRRTFSKKAGFLQLAVLDSTFPDAIAAVEAEAPLNRTLFIVSSKSGGTIEPNSFYAYFRKRVEDSGAATPGRQFAAITDPGTSLEKLAQEAGFRKIWTNPPDIGGRYSALSFFGMVPAALMGIDLPAMLDAAIRMEHSCECTLAPADNPGLRLGAILGEAGLSGRNKVTLVSHPAIATFGAWAEQLIAESTGKQGTGLVPVDEEPLGPPEVYGSDRIFVTIQVQGNSGTDAALEELERAGHPTVRIRMTDPIDLGEEFYRWEMAIGAAGAVLGIDPFDEPNVKESKDNTNDMLAAYQRAGKLPDEDPAIVEDGVALYLSPDDPARTGTAGSISSALRGFLGQARPGDYVAIMAYVTPTGCAWDSLRRSRVVVRDTKKVATTVGYGPRFLHSTGQLHKGGMPTGLFVQITAAPSKDLPIPGQPYTFGTLVAAQAAGDLHSLRTHGLRVLRLHLRTGDRDIEKVAHLFEKACD